eukprot:596217-Pelagomonas_calceolata.AAC.1
MSLQQWMAHAAEPASSKVQGPNRKAPALPSPYRSHTKTPTALPPACSPSPSNASARRSSNTRATSGGSISPLSTSRRSPLLPRAPPPFPPAPVAPPPAPPPTAPAEALPLTRGVPEALSVRPSCHVLPRPYAREDQVRIRIRQGQQQGSSRNMGAADCAKQVLRQSSS